MYCLKCQKTFDDGFGACPHCGASAAPERCPECWTKLSEGESICTKCGCNIAKTLKEREERANYVPPTIMDRLKALPLRAKIAIPLVPVLAAALIGGAVAYTSYTSSRRAKVLAEDFAAKTGEAMEMLTDIAVLYEEEVYNKDWISHIENAANLRDKHKDEITAVKRTREPITYANNLVADAGDDEIASLANDVYYSYTSCYAYVIGETGKYPHYLRNYEKLYEKYEDAVEELKKEIQN